MLYISDIVPAVLLLFLIQFSEELWMNLFYKSVSSKNCWHYLILLNAGEAVCLCVVPLMHAGCWIRLYTNICPCFTSSFQININLGKTSFRYCAPFIWNNSQSRLKLNTRTSTEKSKHFVRGSDDFLFCLIYLIFHFFLLKPMIFKEAFV